MWESGVKEVKATLEPACSRQAWSLRKDPGAPISNTQSKCQRAPTPKDKVVKLLTP